MNCSPDLSPRDLDRMSIVTDALNAAFDWDLPEKFSAQWAGIVGGHANVHFVAEKTGTFVQKVLSAGHAFGPGIRFPLRLPDARFTWALHLPKYECPGGMVVGRAHIDRGDPDSDLAGIAEHVGWDFLVGRFKKDLDPRRY